jgi:Helix-turn-helix domain/Periplasmic binding protein
MRFTLLAVSLLALGVAIEGAAAQDEGPVKIGVLTDMNSLYADIVGEGAVVAARLAVEDAGPVLGKPVELIVGDHQNKADVGSTIVRGWYDACSCDGVGDRQSGRRQLVFHRADYAFGHALERDTAAVIEQNGGKVLGAVSQRSVQEICHRGLGVHPKWLIRCFRLQDAALRPEAEANVSLSWLAQALGYFDQAHFTRDFKRATGVSPGQYRLGVSAGAGASA